MRRHCVELIGRGIGLQREHRVMQRRVDAFAEEDIVDITVALKQLHLRDLLDGAVHLLRDCRPPRHRYKRPGR